MCADFGRLAEEVRSLDDAGADMFHLDVMDGVFVPNYAMGLHDVETVRRVTSKKLDCHLMVANPDLAVEVFANAGADIIHAHVESTQQIARVLQKVADVGVSPGVALNPGTPASALEPLLDIVEYVLVMTVNPGFAGQKYLDWVDRKIAQIVRLRGSRPITISVDGAISPERINSLSAMGVDGFILGTSTLFDQGGDYRSLLDTVRACA
jgi:ribulose-phosphate 3-epimerase